MGNISQNYTWVFFYEMSLCYRYNFSKLMESIKTKPIIIENYFIFNRQIIQTC